MSFLTGLRERLPGVLGYTSGIAFALGWWIFIDGIFQANASKTPYNFGDCITGVLSTLSLFIVNSLDPSALNNGSFNLGNIEGNVMLTRFLAFIGFSMAIGSLGGSILNFVLKEQNDSVHVYVPIIVQNSLILSSSFLFLLSRWVLSTNDYSITI